MKINTTKKLIKFVYTRQEWDDLPENQKFKIIDLHTKKLVLTKLKVK